MAQRVFVIGGAALDITGAPAEVCRLRDSNIGTVRLHAGGVGKNIAQSLTAYDYDVHLITALGQDHRASIIIDACREAGIDVTGALRAPVHSATYLCVLDADGDMLVGVSDMDVIELLTPAYLADRLDALNRSAFVVLDANLSPEALAYLCQSVTCPILYEPVSCAKARRIGEHVGHCYAVKPNRFEAAHLTGISCDTLPGVARAAEWFLERGVVRVFISLAGEGVYWADGAGAGLIEAEPITLVNATGAGDAMCAAIVDGCVRGLSAEDCARNGNHQSALACAQQNRASYGGAVPAFSRRK